MIVGTVTEIKNHEYRVGLVPAGVRALVGSGHQVLVQKGAGLGSGIADEEYAEAGASLVETAEEVWGLSGMVVKVKEPLEAEYPLIRQGQIVFTYLHLAPAPGLTKALVERGCMAVAYETIQLPDGSLPLLTPMSEVAGRKAAQIGAYYLGKSRGGRGVLLGGVPGVERGAVTIIGGGVVGSNAAKIAIGLGARVFVLDVDQKRMAYLDDIFGNRVTTVMSNYDNIRRLTAQSDVVIGSVLIPGAKAPYLVTREMIAAMRPGSVAVDVAIDQGGCFETSRPTSHQDPVYEVDGVIHYCVTNIPGEVAATSTFALTNVTQRYVQAMADKGLTRAVREDAALARGVNVYQGKVVCAPVADAVGLECHGLAECLQ